MDFIDIIMNIAGLIRGVQILLCGQRTSTVCTTALIEDTIAPTMVLELLLALTVQTLLFLALLVRCIKLIWESLSP